MICNMSDTDFDQKIYVRTIDRAKLALDRVVAEMRASGRLRFRDRRPSQEAIVSASWLWMEELQPELLEEAMSRYLPKLEALMRGEEPAEEEPAFRPGDEVPFRYADEPPGSERTLSEREAEKARAEKTKKRRKSG